MVWTRLLRVVWRKNSPSLMKGGRVLHASRLDTQEHLSFRGFRRRVGRLCEADIRAPEIRQWRRSAHGRNQTDD